MQVSASAADPPRTGTGAMRAGWAMSGLVILFLTLDAAMKLAQLPIVAETNAQLGWPTDSATTFGLGILLLGSTLLYRVAPWDATTLATVSVVLLGAALAAFFFPARRGMRVDPAVTLRST